MITCPWCGTNYMQFQPNCQNCGGPLPLPPQEDQADPRPYAEFMDDPTPPPPAPRSAPDYLLMRLLFTDGPGIAGAIFMLMALIFGVLGIALTLAIVTIFVGIPFLGVAFFFFIGGAALLGWRYQTARRLLDVMRTGQATLGEITEVRPDYTVRVNGRYLWRIEYRYTVGSQAYQGRVGLLNYLMPRHRTGSRVYVLYAPEDPQRSTIYGIYPA